MLDIAFVLFIGLLLGMGLKRPFFWVLAYIYIDIVSPQKIGWGLVQAFPLSLIAFVAAFAGWLLLDGKQGARFTFRQGLIALALWRMLTRAELDSDTPDQKPRRPWARERNDA